MEKLVRGLHHITAIAGDPKRNYHFYTKILGLRFIKKTVNFDDPGTYHFYFGDESGTPGTILTFFPWGAGIPQGRRGAGMATEIGYAVPAGSLDFWVNRFEKYNVIYNKPAEKFGEKYLTFLDPDGLKLELVEAAGDLRKGWTTDEIKREVALKGFHNVTVTLHKAALTGDLLTGTLGYRLAGNEVNRYRYENLQSLTAHLVDLVELPHEKRGQVANGTVHHVAFRVTNESELLEIRSAIEERGLQITPVIDRNYFRSLYFREPGGVLFEIASDEPGFTIDESLETLGTQLKLPARYEAQRSQIEARLMALE